MFKFSKESPYRKHHFYSIKIGLVYTVHIEMKDPVFLHTQGAFPLK